jgi:hypothetical protein
MIRNDESQATRSRDETRRRQQLIQRCLAALGTSWASSSCQEMVKANRSIEGGWPGRMEEARTLVQRELTRELAAQGMAPPKPSELAGAPAIVYDHARRGWLQASKAQRLAVRRARAADDE